MSDQGPSLQIDSDWKKQAQEEKRRLAEQEKALPPVQATAPIPPSAAVGARGTSAATGASRELPSASFATLVQSVVTQALYHLGELSVRGGEPTVNLDMAKHHIDTLGLIEEKTVNNLTADEAKLLDSALYETRMRYVSVASQYIS